MAVSGDGIVEHRHCVVQREGHLTIVTIRRPEVLNSLHYEADLELSAIWDDYSRDPQQWVAIITGAGDRAFSAGNDLKAHARIGRRQVAPGGFAGLSARLDLDKPVIAAVNGLALGGGFEAVLACDVVVADERALFGLPEPRVGLVAFSGGVQHLPRAIGWQRAMGMLLTGRHVSAAEGHALGFVTALAPPGQALAHARNWAAQMLACSPMALRAAKQVARQTLFGPDFVARFRAAREYPAAQELLASEDFLEGPRAFAEKRPPAWKNR